MSAQAGAEIHLEDTDAEWRRCTAQQWFGGDIQRRWAQGAPRALIAYDGSPSASTAVRVAASLLGDARVCVATVPSEPTVRAGAAVVTMLFETTPR